MNILFKKKKKAEPYTPIQVKKIPATVLKLNNTESKISKHEIGEKALQIDHNKGLTVKITIILS